jgi:hypothetical protein
MKNVRKLPYLPSSNYSTVQQSTRYSNHTDSTLVKGSTTRPTSSTVMKLRHGTIVGQGTGPRTGRQILRSTT